MPVNTKTKILRWNENMVELLLPAQTELKINFLELARYPDLRVNQLTAPSSRSVTISRGLCRVVAAYSSGAVHDFHMTSLVNS